MAKLMNYLMNRMFKRTAFIRNTFFCYIINVFTFGQFNISSYLKAIQGCVWFNDKSFMIL